MIRDVLGCNIIAIDIEGTSTWSHPNVVSLMQVATSSNIYIVDIMQLKNLHVDFVSLCDVLEEPSIIKVVHAAGNDIQYLFHELHVRLAGLWDTSAAAAALGESKLGYTSVLNKFLPDVVTHNKMYQTYDWSYRPLHPQALEYAASDVLHLMDLHRAQLAEAKRVNKLEAVVDAIMKVETKEIASQAIKPSKMKKMFNVSDPAQQQRLCALYIWREELGRVAQFPPGRLIFNAALLGYSKVCLPNGLLNVDYVARSERYNVQNMHKIADRITVELQDMPPNIVSEIVQRITDKLGPYYALDVAQVTTLLKQSCTNDL